MSLQIDRALREGFQRTIAKNGLMLIGVFLVFGALSTVVGQSLANEVFQFVQESLNQPPAIFEQSGANPFAPGAAQQRPFAVELPLPVLAGLSLLSMFLAESLRIVAIRVFASAATETIPSRTVRDRIVLATLNGVVVGVLAAIASVLGLFLLVVPGIYIALSFFFVRQEVAVADKNIVDALRDGWRVTAGNRWELLGLAVIVAVINAVAGSPSMVLAFVDQTIATALSVGIGAVTTVFGIAVATRAYVQLTGEDTTTNCGETTTGDTRDRFTGA